MPQGVTDKCCDRERCGDTATIHGTRHTVSTNGHARQSIIICSVRSRSLRGSSLDLQIRSNWALTPHSVDKPCFLISNEKSPVQLSSVRDGIYMRSEKPICAPPCLSQVPPLKQLQCSFLTDDGLFSCLSWKICRALPLSTPLSSRRSMVWRVWLCARW